MKPTKAYYSVIQFCPDLARLEAANIGVLLFCPEQHFLQTRMAQGTQRLRRFFGSEGHDWSQIESFKTGFAERISLELASIRKREDLEHFIATRANAIQLSPLRPMVVTEPERDLDQLFRELVVGEPRRTKSTGLRRYLSERFAQAGLERKLLKDIQITVPVLQRRVEVPFGFQNGRFNLIQPARFRAGNPVQAEATASRYAVLGRSLYEQGDPKLGPVQLLVVGDFGTGPAESQAVAERILKENQVILIPSSNLDPLIEKISTSMDVEVQPA